MRQHLPKHHQQRGAVAVMTGLLLMLVLIPVSGLVLDLGHLYIVKTELQNLADASALAAGKDLDNSDAGLNKAVASGKALALKNRYDFGSTLTLQDVNFRFSAAPDGPWYTLAQSLGNAMGRTFVEVNTKVGGDAGTAQSINTWLMRIAGKNSTATFGSAVAGRFVNTVTPVGICAIDPTRRTDSYDYGGGLTEVVEFGFRRGVSYNVFDLGSLGGSTSDPYQINPVNSPPNGCVPANSSTNVVEPFICVGNSAVLPTGIGKVYTNTGVSATLENAFNSRFNDFSGGSKCDPASAPPDINVKEYLSGAGNPPAGWQDSGGTTLPSQQSISTSGTPKLPQYSLPSEARTSAPTKVWPSTPSTRVTTPATYAEYGAMWSYTPAVQSNGSTAITPAQANGTIGTNAVGTDKLMYGLKGGATDYIDAATYPTSVGPGFTSQFPAPYNQASGPTFLAPAGRTGVENRRVLNIVLIDCTKAPVGSASCGVMDVVGIGKFFMQRKADLSGSPKKLWVEFTGLVEPVPSSEVKLYK